MMFSLLFISFVQRLQLDIALYNSRANFRRRIGIMQRLVLFSIPCPTLCWKVRTPRKHWCGEKYFASLSPTRKRRLLKTYKSGHGSFMHSLIKKAPYTYFRFSDVSRATTTLFSKAIVAVIDLKL